MEKRQDKLRLILQSLTLLHLNEREEEQKWDFSSILTIRNLK